MTGIVSASTLKRARAALARLHATDAVHSKLTVTVSSTGAESHSWASAGTVKCRVETDMGTTKQGSVNGEAPADRTLYEYAVHVAHDADIATGDRLTLASGIVLSVEQDSRGQSQGFIGVLHCTEVQS